MKVKLLDCMGSDLTVVNAARVSFNKEHKKFQSNDPGLINYLAKHGHWTPFGHPQISLHFKVPIFVARQLHKHQVGFVVNEVSRRYVDEEPEFYVIEEYRGKSEDKKQGSSVPLNSEKQIEAALLDDALAILCHKAYRRFLELGVCPEQARAILPLSTYTEFWMTGSLAAWSRLYKLRIQPDAQKEVQDVAKQIGEVVAPLFPVSWKALNE